MGSGSTSGAGAVNCAYSIVVPSTSTVSAANVKSTLTGKSTAQLTTAFSAKVAAVNANYSVTVDSKSDVTEVVPKASASGAPSLMGIGAITSVAMAVVASVW